LDVEYEHHFAPQDDNVDRWGVVSEYVDNGGQRRITSPETRQALHAAMGESPSQLFDGSAWPPVMVVRAGEMTPVPAPGELTLEDGAALPIHESLPHDLPLGYHELRALKGDGRTRVIVCPEACLLDPAMRIWGWSAQLYAARSKQSWGIGDMADLHRLARWSKQCGAEMLMVNPLTASAPFPIHEASPYYPTSRRFRNPLYLCVEEVPGAAECELDWIDLSVAGRKLNDDRRIDRQRVFELKIPALTKIWDRVRETCNGAFEDYCRQQGESLRQYATYCVLAEQFGGDWRQWDSEYQRHDSQAVHQFRQERGERVRFHQWLQWLLDDQFARAAREIRIVQDLPIGFDPGGADAWVWQDMIACGVSVGAPPDQFNIEGQNWQLSPLIPHRLKAAGYQPFIETVQASLRHAGGLLIDHVMGLHRLFWIPPGTPAWEGAYVRCPFEDLLGILALESHRAGAWVAGEDLGTVPAEVRCGVEQHRILSYRLLLFEDGSPADFPWQAMAALSTHDLPTAAGLWSGADVAACLERGIPTAAAGWEGIRRRWASATGLALDAPIEELIARIYAYLAQAPSAVLVASLNDALTVEERPNMPGTISEWPNWSIGLPKSIESLESARLPESIAKSLARRG
jgi:4-alpha-glucanotransferase